MKNSYYIKWGRAGNEYDLCYAPEGVNPGDGWEQITRKKAEKYAAAEARRREDEPSSAYFAEAYIYPYDMNEDEAYAFYCRHLGWHTVGRVVVPGKRLKMREAG